MNQKQLFKIKFFVIISLLIVFVFGSPIFGIPKSTNNSPTDFSKLIPANQNYRSEATTVGGKVHFWFTYQVKVDNISGEVLVETLSDEVKFSGRFNHRSELKKA